MERIVGILSYLLRLLFNLLATNLRRKIVVAHQVDRPPLGNDELARKMLASMEALVAMEKGKNCNVFFASLLSGFEPMDRKCKTYVMINNI